MDLFWPNYIKVGRVKKITFFYLFIFFSSFNITNILLQKIRFFILKDSCNISATSIFHLRPKFFSFFISIFFKINHLIQKDVSLLQNEVKKIINFFLLLKNWSTLTKLKPPRKNQIAMIFFASLFLAFYLDYNNNNKSFYSPQHFSYKTQNFYKNNFWDERGIACSIRAFSGFSHWMNKKIENVWLNQT